MRARVLRALARMVIVAALKLAAVLEHVKLIVAAASTRGNTVIDFRFVDRGYTALEAESALIFGTALYLFVA